MKKCGVLLHISSLPSDYGIGSLGDEALKFADFLAEAKQNFWQMLPVNPTGYGDSPYQSCSAFAGNEYFIDLKMLLEENLLSEVDLSEVFFGGGDSVDYAAIFQSRNILLKRAYTRFLKSHDAKFDAFVREECAWLDGYALFMALKERFSLNSWDKWPIEYRDVSSSAVKDFASSNANCVNYYKFKQYLFDRQWKKLKEYCTKKGIEIIGDAPIYVSYDSADVWQNPNYFMLDEKRKPIKVAGVPPDDFSADGQLWGNPVYDWQKMKDDGYSWWVERMKRAMKVYDVVRIDHFRGFESFYCVDSGSVDAKEGIWLKGPGSELFETLEKEIPRLKVIAEDLGFLDDKVRDMVAKTGYPGIKVLQFGMEGGKEYLPENYTQNCVAYTGTHDNNTSKGWYKELTLKDKLKARRLLKCGLFKRIVPAMIQALMKSSADIVIIPLQDYLDEGGWARMNTPGTKSGNWGYRLKTWNLSSLAAKLQKYALLRK